MKIFKTESIILFLEDMSKIFDDDFLYKSARLNLSVDDYVLIEFSNNKINNWIYYDSEQKNIFPFIFDKVKCYKSSHDICFSRSFFLNNKQVDEGWDYVDNSEDIRSWSISLYNVFVNISTLKQTLIERKEGHN